MASCKKCGAALPEDAIVCSACGAPVKEEKSAGINDTVEQAVNQTQQTFEKLNDTPDATGECSSEEIQNGKVMGVLAYLGILVLIPLLAETNNRFVKFHTNQGLVLFITEIIYNVAGRILLKVLGFISWAVAGIVGTLLNLVSLVFLVLLIIGIVNVCNGKAKELPIIGGIKILK